jgi:branched-subunit amino acid transport protein
MMALITYGIRFLPLGLFTKKITSPFIKSFLYYIPYAVLGAMTFPSILYSTENMYFSLGGTLVAILLAYFEKSLLTVAISAVMTVLVLGLLF